MNDEQVRKIGLQMIQVFGQYGATMKAGRPTIEFRLAKARFEGMAVIAAIALGAPTAFAIELALIEAEREHDKMPPPSPMNYPIKAWEQVMLKSFTEANARGWMS